MPIGKAVCLASGLALTNSYEVRTANVQNFAKTTLAFEAVKIGSGIGYYIHGYPVGGYPAYSIIGSGSITTSGSYTILTSGLDDSYDELRIAAKNLVNDQSGAVTILISRRRH